MSDSHSDPHPESPEPRDLNDLDTAWAAIGQTEGAARADALLDLGVQLFEAGDHEAALAAADAAQALFVEAGQATEAATCDHNAAVCLLAMGRCREAADRHAEAIAAHERAGRVFEAAACRTHLAEIEREHGRVKEASRLFIAAVRALRAGDDMSSVLADALLGAGETKLELGEVDKALPYLFDAIYLLELSAPVALVARGRRALAAALAALDRWNEALAELKAARAIYDALAIDDAVSECDVRIAGLLVEAHDPLACDALESTRVAERAAGRAASVARCDYWLGLAYLELIDDAESAMEVLDGAVAVFRACARFADAAEAEALLAEAHVAVGQADAAVELLRRALPVLRRERRPRAEARALVVNARLLLARGAVDKASRAVRRARTLLTKGGSPATARAVGDLAEVVTAA